MRGFVVGLVLGELLVACSSSPRSFGSSNRGGGGGDSSSGTSGAGRPGVAGAAGSSSERAGASAVSDAGEAGVSDSGGGSGGDSGASGGTASEGGGSSVAGGGTSAAGAGGKASGGTSGAGGAGKGGSSSGGTSGAGGSGSTSAGAAGAGDTTAPTIVSISPTNQATGVKSTAQIKITFSEVMNSSTATQAVQVGGFVASDANTSWDTAGKVLSVTPKAGFAYATGSSPAGTPAAKYTVTVGTGATDLAGNHLASAFSSSFTTLRHITQSIASGTAATYSTYGNAVGDGPQFCPANDPIWVEIWSGIASGGTYYVFAPFDTTVMGNASSITLETATFSATQAAAGGAFYSAHQVVLKKVTSQAIDKTVLSASVTDNFGVFASSAVAQPTANVFSTLSADLAANVRQELFRLEPTGTADSGTQANFTCGGFFLNVMYFTP